MIRNKNRNEKGITLIALVLTIIVLLILAVVALGAVRDSDIINHAQNAADTYNTQKGVEELNHEIKMKQIELDDIKKQFDIYKAKMESLLISQLELLKDINKD